jgi:hypothetical protein
MKEEFLNFIWKNQYFGKRQLETYQGEVLQVLNPGQINANSGPDFSNARIKLASTDWAGPIEIHVRSSDWYLHQHQKDPAYDQVVLHVVWVNNVNAKTSNGREIPTLELKDRVEGDLLLRHQKLGKGNSFIPCERQSDRIPLNRFKKMLEHTIRQRIERKSQEVIALLDRHSYNWDQVTYLVLGKNFGFHVNTDAFETLVGVVPLPTVRKMRSNIIQLESLFFGQAGFLQRVTGDSYYLRLQREYEFLTKKYSFKQGLMKKEMWKYLRLRPSNFPGLRIAQFVSMMQLEGFRFSNIREALTANQFSRMVVKPSSYWDDHYDFGKKWDVGRSALGKSSKENLVINTVVPLLVAYADYTGQPIYRKRAIGLMKQVPPEQNRMVSYWKDKGFEVSSAYYSQAVIELNNQYCNLRKCLDCFIGQSLLTGAPKL